MKVELDVTEHQQWNRCGIWRQSKREKKPTTINTQQKTTNNPQSNLPRLPGSNGSFRSLIKGYLLYKVALSPYVRSRPLLGWLEKLLSHTAESGGKSRDTVFAGYLWGHDPVMGHLYQKQNRLQANYQADSLWGKGSEDITLEEKVHKPDGAYNTRKPKWSDKLGFSPPTTYHSISSLNKFS